MIDRAQRNTVVQVIWLEFGGKEILSAASKRSPRHMSGGLATGGLTRRHHGQGADRGPAPLPKPVFQSGSTEGCLSCRASIGYPNPDSIPAVGNGSHLRRPPKSKRRMTKGHIPGMAPRSGSKFFRSVETMSDSAL